MRFDQHHIARLSAKAMLAGSALVFAATSCFGQTTNIYIASAYGAKVNVGSTVKLGPIAPAQLPGCSTQPVATYMATAGSVKGGGLISTGVVDTSASNTATTATGVSDIHNISLLGGLITANELKSVSMTSVDSKGVFHFDASQSKFVGLSVLGLPISLHPAANTTIDLPGIGEVIVNEQITKLLSNESQLTVNMVHIRVTVANLLGFPLGTEVIVSSAMSEVKAIHGSGAVGGYAQAPQLVVGPITSGPLVRVLIPCEGTGGAVETDTIAATNIPNIVTTGTVTVTGRGTINHQMASSEATTTLAGVKLLSGLVSATAIKGVADGVTTDGTKFEFTGATTFGSLSIAGHPEITVNVAPNTKITIANLGTLYINRVTRFTDKIKVTPLELVVSTANSLGLAVGADLTIGAAEAQLHSATIP